MKYLAVYFMVLMNRLSLVLQEYKLLKYNRVTVLQLDVDDNTQNTFVLIGACGDLASKKTFPALYGLHMGRHLSTSQKIIGCDSSGYHPDVKSTQDLWQYRVRPYCAAEAGSSEEDLNDFRERIEFMNLNLDDPQMWKALNDQIERHVSGRSVDNRIFYLALPPFLFEKAVKNIKTHCYSSNGHNRVIVEKPFGNNLEEARALSDKLSVYLEEHEIFRIDHYLAKTLVLNMLALRFANREIGRLFHSDCIANVRITFKEDIDCAGRAGYFDEYGIIRDIMQNHLMQVLSLVAMEAPASLEPEDVRDEKVKVLKQVRPVDIKNNCVIGQYEGYQEDPQIVKVNEKKGFASRTPTFATMVFYIDNERWSGVPFIMKAGKALHGRSTILRIQFKKAPPCSLFGDQPQNELVMRIQPNERIYWKLLAKMPGLSQGDQDVQQTILDLDIKARSGIAHVPQAYEKLIYDAMEGQSHNFVRRDELEESWRIFDPVIRYMEDVEKREPLVYRCGSRGPAKADMLINELGYQRYTVSGVPGYAESDID